MSFGVTDQGFVTKRLPDIKLEIESTIRDTFGSGIDLTAESPLGQIIGVFAERESKLWELAEGVYYSAYPDTAEGVSLDNAVALTGIVRQGQTYSTVEAIFYGVPGTLIPVGSIASVDGDPDARFVTSVPLTIGSPVDEVQKVSFGSTPASGAWSLVFMAQTTGSLAYNANAATVQTALRALSTLSDDLTVSGNYASGFTVTFTGADGSVNQASITVGSNTLLTAGAAPVSITITTETQGSPAQAIGELTAESPGAVAAPANSLTEIETPVVGWSSITNPLDAEVGEEVESDAALRLRRAASLQKAGSGTIEAIRSDLLELPDVDSVLVFENASLVTDGDGRPAKSFEVVILGGVDADIAQTIWQDKPAGIETFGGVTVAVTDSQGFLHDIKFSRPDEVPIYISIDLTVTAAFPADGEERVSNALLAYGASLSLGDDVIVYPALMAAIGSIPGIIDVAIRVGIAASPTLDNNISIDSFEIAVFDSSRIEVNVL